MSHSLCIVMGSDNEEVRGVKEVALCCCGGGGDTGEQKW